MSTIRSLTGRRPTRNDVARVANVSGWTVSKVLNADLTAPISDETRQRVLQAARELNYRPNSSARALVTGRSSIIGVCMAFVYSQYRVHVLHRLQSIVRASAMNLVISDIEEELRYGQGLRTVFELPLDGIIAFDLVEGGQALVAADASGSVPFVSMGAFWEPERDYVGVDLYSGAREALQHLTDTGRKRIAYLLPEESRSTGVPPTDGRLRAYEDHTREVGIPQRLVRARDFSLSASWEAILKLLGEDRTIDAIFCNNDDMAIGAHRALMDLGIRIGPEIALIGCDGIEETEFVAPPISTIVQPVDEMCALAWQFLQARIKEPGIPRQACVLKPKFVERSSSRT